MFHSALLHARSFKVDGLGLPVETIPDSHNVPIEYLMVEILAQFLMFPGGLPSWQIANRFGVYDIFTARLEPKARAVHL